jgi:TPR repeat protein
VQAQAELDKLKSNDIDYLAGVAAAQRSDYQTAFAALTRSAERGVPEAQERLGRLYYYGRGTAKDMKQAWRLFKLAADKDIGDAHNMLGVMLG